MNLSLYKIQNIPIEIYFMSPGKLRVAEILTCELLQVASCESQRTVVQVSGEKVEARDAFLELIS